MVLWPKIIHYGQCYGQSVADYFVLMADKFAELTRKVEGDTRVEITQGGLHPMIQQELHGTEGLTLLQLKKEALEIECLFLHSGHWPLIDKGSGLGDQMEILVQWSNKGKGIRSDNKEAPSSKPNTDPPKTNSGGQPNNTPGGTQNSKKREKNADPAHPSPKTPNPPAKASTGTEGDKKTNPTTGKTGEQQALKCWGCGYPDVKRVDVLGGVRKRKTLPMLLRPKIPIWRLSKTPECWCNTILPEKRGTIAWSVWTSGLKAICQRPSSMEAQPPL